MVSLAGCFIVSPSSPVGAFRYKVISSVADYESGYDCIVVPALDPDFYILLGSVGLIVTERGGALSHLAIVAREYNIPVFLAGDAIGRIPPAGMLSIKGGALEVGDV